MRLSPHPVDSKRSFGQRHGFSVHVGDDREWVVASEQWVVETGIAVPPTPVFWQKRLQALENKGRECGKERKETTKRLQVSENMGFATEAPRH
jgi:hypothetical protein